MDSLKSSAAYKRIDTIPKLLEYMWSLFPNIIAIKNGFEKSTSILGSLNKKMYDPMIQNSVEFCDLLAKNILKFNPSPKEDLDKLDHLQLTKINIINL